MPWLTDLADVCRTSGLRVVEVDGWRTRGHGPMTDVQTIVDHHTATPDHYEGDYPSLAVVRDGRADLAGPLAHLGLGRSGTVYVIAAGLAYHAGVVKDPSYANAHSIGIEGESAGYGKWTPEQRAAWPKLNAALCRGYGLDAPRVFAHREVCYPEGRKPDPVGIDMDEQRTDVARDLAGGEEDDMPSLDEIQDTVRAEVGRALRAFLLGQPNEAYNPEQVKELREIPPNGVLAADLRRITVEVQQSEVKIDESNAKLDQVLAGQEGDQ